MACIVGILSGVWLNIQWVYLLFLVIEYSMKKDNKKAPKWGGITWLALGLVLSNHLQTD